ncbi:CYTH and CHAD domain-containing protein [Paracoccus actinidiae]|uniref:CYTH and CHAD domain-containing protein n=1 Tax=Paracoccus actinidiae TaxID=3064531 RepID=UPI0027D2173F|nr:CHAD domain-containing protein [Paracoccus sp. M09]
MDEIELKLELSEAAAKTLEATDLLPGSPKGIEQTSIYFDTPDRALAAAGVSLRIRQAKGKRVQTVKQGNGSAAGLFARPEQEKFLDSALPDLDDTLLPALLGTRAQRIVPVFTVRATRRTWMLDEEEARIELVIDRGAVSAADRSTPVSECELELKSGPPEALFRLAQRLNSIAPVKLGILTKSDRGYRLLEAARVSHKAEAVALDGSLSAAQAFQSIALSCIRQFRLNEDLVLVTRASEPLHQARVALRRLRSAFSIYQPMLGENGAALREELRWLARELGHARDLDVLLERAAESPLFEQIRKGREAAYDRVSEALGSDRTRRLMLDLAEWLHGGPWLTDPDGEMVRSMPARDFASSALSRYRRKIKKAGRGLITLEEEARHELRKDAKKLRYASEFFTSLFDTDELRKRRKQFGTALEDFQEHLGALNDLSAAPEVLDHLGITPQARGGLLRKESRGGS